MIDQNKLVSEINMMSCSIHHKPAEAMLNSEGKLQVSACCEDFHAEISKAIDRISLSQIDKTVQEKFRDGHK